MVEIKRTELMWAGKYDETRRQRTYDKIRIYKVLVKVVDIFGNVTTKAIKVKIG